MSHAPTDLVRSCEIHGTLVTNKVLTVSVDICTLVLRSIGDTAPLRATPSRTPLLMRPLDARSAAQTRCLGSRTPSALGSSGYEYRKLSVAPMISKIQQKHHSFRECPLCILMSDTGSRGNALYHRRHRCIQDEPHHSYIHAFYPRGVRHDFPSCCREPWSSNVAVPVRCSAYDILWHTARQQYSTVPSSYPPICHAHRRRSTPCH